MCRHYFFLSISIHVKREVNSGNCVQLYLHVFDIGIAELWQEQNIHEKSPLTDIFWYNQ